MVFIEDLERVVQQGVGSETVAALAQLVTLVGPHQIRKLVETDRTVACNMHAADNYSQTPDDGVGVAEKNLGFFKSPA